MKNLLKLTAKDPLRPVLEGVYMTKNENGDKVAKITNSKYALEVAYQYPEYMAEKIVGDKNPDIEGKFPDLNRLIPRTHPVKTREIELDDMLKSIMRFCGKKPAKYGETMAVSPALIDNDLCIDLQNLIGCLQYLCSRPDINKKATIERRNSEQVVVIRNERFTFIVMPVLFDSLSIHVNYQLF